MKLQDVGKNSISSFMKAPKKYVQVWCDVMWPCVNKSVHFLVCWYVSRCLSICFCVCECTCVYVWVYIYDCASWHKIYSDQHGKMNIFTCSQNIPRPYQLSNGIFVPINIENWHDRLCALFWRCTSLPLIGTFTFELCLIEVVQAQRWNVKNLNSMFTLLRCGKWMEPIQLQASTQKSIIKSQKHFHNSFHWNMKRVDAEQSWKGRVGSRYKLTAGAGKQKLIKQGEMP